MLLAIDKPTWISTFDVIRRLRKTYPKLKMWHCGTLDPLATGLVIIWTENDTKQMTNIIWLDKKYLATIDFSQISDTRDTDFWDYQKQFEYTNIWNDVIFEGQNIYDIYQKIVWLMDSLVWSPELPLPIFSAKKVKGKKLYELARKWIDIEQFRIMKIYDYKIISFEFPFLEIHISVGSGTYIRSIAHRLGKQLWTGGIISWLRRENIGKLDINWLRLKYLFNSDIYMSEVQTNDII